MSTAAQNQYAPPSAASAHPPPRADHLPCFGITVAKRGGHFTLMVVGESGLGKTTLVYAVLHRLRDSESEGGRLGRAASCPSVDHRLEQTDRRRRRAKSSRTGQQTGLTAPNTATDHRPPWTRAGTRCSRPNSPPSRTTRAASPSRWTRRPRSVHFLAFRPERPGLGNGRPVRGRLVRGTSLQRRTRADRDPLHADRHCQGRARGEAVQGQAERRRHARFRRLCQQPRFVEPDRRLYRASCRTDQIRG